jgi:hypothetical protein
MFYFLFGRCGYGTYCSTVPAAYLIDIFCRQELENIRRRAKEKFEDRTQQRLEQALQNRQDRQQAKASEPEIAAAESSAQPRRKEPRLEGRGRVADESESDEEEDSNGGLHMFPGLVAYWAGLKEEVHEDQEDEADMMGLGEGVHISDDEDDLVSVRISGDDFISDKKEHLPTQSLVEVKPEENKSDLKNAKPDAHRLYLGGLLGVYADDGVDNGSDSDDEDGPPVEVKTIKSLDNSILPPPVVAPPPVEIKSESVRTVEGSETGKSRHRKRKQKDAAEKSSLPPPPKVERPDVLCQPMRPPTLLEKLLLDEINRERNVVLQCVRYVCDKNFFLD